MSSETSLHAALKKYFTSPGDQQEVWVSGYWIDVVHQGLLLEIQTRNFSYLKPKLEELLQIHQVRVVYPIAIEKWIVKLPAIGEEPISRRKSPRTGRIEHIFTELIRLPKILTHPNFSLAVIFIVEEEIRRDDGKGSWRRGGVSIVDRHLLSIIDQRIFNRPQDLYSLLPTGLPQPFTNRQLASELQIPVRLASRMTYCLRASGLVRICGKHQRQLLFDLISE